VELRDDRPLRQALRTSEGTAGRAVFVLLRRELGLRATLRVLAAMGRRRLRGEPFAGLGPARDRRDELTRRQLGPAVLLLRALRAEVPPGRAEAIAHAAIREGGLAFLGALLGDLDPRRIEDLSREVSTRLSRFFNAEGGVAFDAAAGTIDYTMTRCRFVDLAPRVGASALLPAFCAVDEAFFARPTVPLRLSREHTLARGDAACDFRFTWTP